MNASVKQQDLPLPGWEIRPLGEVVRPTRPRIKPSEKPHLPFIGMEHIEAHTMKLLGTVPAGTMKSSAVHFQPGDVLYGRLRPYLNKVYRPDFEGLCSAEFIVFPKTEGVESRYLQYFLNSSTFVSFASRLNTGDRPRVDFDQLAPYSFPLAPFDQQKRIVAEIEKQFSRLDEAVANLKRVKANLKRYKAAVLKAAVEGRLVETEPELARREGRSYETGAQLLQRILETRRSQWKGKGKYKEPTAPDTTDLPELPEGWVWASTEQVCASVRDGTHDTPAYVETGVPLITSKNLTDQGIDFENVKFISEQDHVEISRRSGVESGDVLFAMIGTVGNPCEIKTDARFGIKNVGLFKQNPVFLNSAYLCYWLASPPLNKWLEPRLKGTTQKFAPLGLLREIPVPVFPLRDQNRIVAEVDRRFSLVRETEAQVNANLMRVDRLRQAILSNAFAGRIDRRHEVSLHQNPAHMEGAI